MNKQEFMAMSLPFGLKVLRGDNTTILKVSGIDIDCKSLLFTENHTTTYGSISHSKPILRPLSDLTKEIDNSGEKFTPIVYLGWYINLRGWSDSNTKLAIGNMSFVDSMKLIEWHFDICGLIESGEAVDYHTLPDFVF